MPGSTARPPRPALFSPLPILLALGVLLTAAHFAFAASDDVARIVDVGSVVLASVLAAFVVHSTAHWLAARWAGFRTVTVTIGPLVFTPTRRGLRVRPVRAWSELGGVLLAEPTGERRANARWALVVAAGPLASLALAALTLDAAPLFAVASVLRFTFSALPYRYGAESSDGARLSVLLAGGAAADRLGALQRVAAAHYAGVRPRLWPERWTVDATAIRDGTRAEALGCVAAFRRALDGCAHERAAAQLDRALALRALLPSRDACALLADAAYFEARIHQDAVRGRAWLDEAATRRPACPVAQRRAAAAVFLAAGDPRSGAVVAREALELLEALEQVEGRAQPMEGDWLREMLARAECACVLPAELLATAG